MKTSLNTSTVRDMTVGNPARQILIFAFPVFLSQLFQQLYNTADTYIVGRFIGSEALAAVSSSGPLIFLLTSFFIGVSTGAGVVISRYFGARNEDTVSRAIHTNVAFGAVSGLLITVVGVLFTPLFLEWMNTDPAIRPQAAMYFAFYFSGGIFTVLYNTLQGIMNAVGDSRRPLYYLIFSSLLNIALDLLFVAGFGWGVWSAAVATVISQAASTVLCWVHLTKKGFVYTVEWKKIRFHWDMLKEIIRYGFPAGIQNSVIGLANVVVQSQINSFGKFATGAFGIHSKVEGFAFLPITSFTMAITTFISQNLGARQYERAKKGALFGILSAVVIAEIIGAILYIFSPQIVRLFDTTPEVVELGVAQGRTVALFYCLLAYSHAVAAVCRGAGKAFVPMLVMLSVWCVIRIIYIITVMHIFHDIRYIYWAYPITWSISSVIYFLYFTFSDWVHGFEDKTRRGWHERRAKMENR